MHKLALLKVVSQKWESDPIHLIVKPGITAQALLERLHVPNHVLVRINRGLVLSPEAEVYPHINNDGEEFVAAEIQWPKMARRFKSQRSGRIHS